MSDMFNKMALFNTNLSWLSCLVPPPWIWAIQETYSGKGAFKGDLSKSSTTTVRWFCWEHYIEKFKSVIFETWYVFTNKSCTIVVRQISSKIIICGDRVYHRKFRYELKDVIIEFKDIQKRLNELLETQWFECCMSLIFKFVKVMLSIIKLCHSI